MGCNTHDPLRQEPIHPSSPSRRAAASFNPQCESASAGVGISRRTILQGSWLAKILARKPKMLVAIALANKMARQLWAMVTKNEDYRDPALAAAA
jgi:hypothetical protein